MDAVSTARPAAAGLGFHVPVDELGRYAGLTALASAVLAAAGILSTVAYLSAWNVPPPVVRLDPLTAALRSEVVLYQVGLLPLIVYGLQAVARRVERRRAARIAAIGLTLVALAYLGIDVVLGGFVGPVITLIGGVGLFVAARRQLLSARSRAIAFSLIALLAAYQTGAESGRLIRDDTLWQTPVTLTTRVTLGGLDGAVERGGGWHYEALYLVFRDGEAVYVSRPGSGSEIWIVPAGNVMSLGLLAVSR